MSNSIPVMSCSCLGEGSLNIDKMPTRFFILGKSREMIGDVQMGWHPSGLE